MDKTTTFGDDNERKTKLETLWILYCYNHVYTMSKNLLNI